MCTLPYKTLPISCLLLQLLLTVLLPLLGPGRLLMQVRLMWTAQCPPGWSLQAPLHSTAHHNTAQHSKAGHAKSKVTDHASCAFVGLVFCPARRGNTRNPVKNSRAGSKHLSADTSAAAAFNNFTHQVHLLAAAALQMPASTHGSCLPLLLPHRLTCQCLSGTAAHGQACASTRAPCTR